MIDYSITVLVLAGCYAILALGLNLQWGLTGLMNFGQVAFMAIGAYTTAILSGHGVALPAAILAGMALAAVFGLVVAISGLRLREDFFAIVTLGFSEAVRILVHSHGWVIRFTRGPFGIGRFPKPLEDLVSAKDYDYVLLALLAGIVLFLLAMLFVLVRSPWGRVLKSIREDEDVAAALGKNVFLYKVQSMMLGCALGGLAGACFAYRAPYIHPDIYEPLVTFYALTIIVIGGAGSNRGTALGAVIFSAIISAKRFIPDSVPLDSTEIAALEVIVMGIALVALMMYRPQGILGKKEELTIGQ